MLRINIHTFTKTTVIAALATLALGLSSLVTPADAITVKSVEPLSRLEMGKPQKTPTGSVTLEKTSDGRAAVIYRNAKEEVLRRYVLSQADVGGFFYVYPPTGSVLRPAHAELNGECGLLLNSFQITATDGSIATVNFDSNNTSNRDFDAVTFMGALGGVFVE